MLDTQRARVEMLPNGPTVFQRGEEWFATLDGRDMVSIPAELGSNIALALRVQDKIDDALMSGTRPGFLATIRMLNCRKAVSAVRETRSLRDLVHGTKNGDTASVSVEEMSGVSELLDDVQRLARLGKTPVLGTSQETHIPEHLDEHLGELPAVVHIFNIMPQYERTVLSKLMQGPDSMTRKDYKSMLHRDHTFLVLGKTEKGTYICFQKQGPDIHHRFELRELSSILEKTANDEERTYLSVVGPI